MVNTKPAVKKIWGALEQIPDPEIPVVNVVEMGIVREVKLSDETVTVIMTPTFSGCPALELMREAIRERLCKLGFAKVTILLHLSPVWTTDWISAEAKEKLRCYGIAMTLRSNTDLIQLEPAPVSCPRCGSPDTSSKNVFGSTLCKSLYYCHACQEPFEAFKAV
jgi:ring-1,2-phenylacetyl-CoA epoxidase subunit PaaD